MAVEIASPPALPPAGSRSREPTLARETTEATPLLQDGHFGNVATEHDVSSGSSSERHEAANPDHNTTFLREFKIITEYTLPLILTLFFQYMINVSSLFTVGKIGPTELAAASLATMTSNITCYVFVMGMATSLDTLCPQAYGAKKYHLVGLHLQRMIVFLLPCLVPLMILWWNGGKLLALIIPAKDAAQLAGTYLRVMILGSPAFVIFECGKRFVQAQGLFHITTYVIVIAAAANMFLMWLFVWHLGWGFIGAPTALVITQNLEAALLVLFVLMTGGLKCWGGLSRKAFTNWKPMLSLALPSMVMLVAEFSLIEILILTSGQFGTIPLAAMSAVATIGAAIFYIPFSVSVAASTRMGNLIGGQLLGPAKITFNVTILMSSSLVLLDSAMLAGLRHVLPQLFTNDTDVLVLAESVMPMVAVMHIFDGMATVAQGILRAMGWQQFGSYASLGGYYLIAIPVSMSAAFGLGWQLHGLYCGLISGLFFVFIVDFWWLYRSNWQAAVDAADRRNDAE